jgi:peptide chain release factor 3
VDSVVMVIDAGKGIEAQTRKLFEICRRRGIPIFTFMNKMDRPARDPLDLLDELERVLGLEAYAINWPLGSGVDFKGVFDRTKNQVHFFERVPGGAYKAPVFVHGIEDEAVKGSLSPEVYLRVTEEHEMLEHAGARYSKEAVDKGLLTPVFFGSAVNNFGVQLLLDGFLQRASPPRARVVDDVVIEPASPRFSGFIFKIQANMDPKHRDR